MSAQRVPAGHRRWQNGQAGPVRRWCPSPACEPPHPNPLPAGERELTELSR